MTITNEQIRAMADGCKQCGDSRVGEMLEAWLTERQAARNGIVVTKDEAGQIVAVTRQDKDGRVLEVIAESTAQPARVPEKMCMYSSGGMTYCHDYQVGDQVVAAHEEYARGWNTCREAMLSTSPQPQQAAPDGWKIRREESDIFPVRIEAPDGSVWYPECSQASARLALAMLSAAPAYNGKKEG